MAGSLDASPDDGVDHGDVADYHCDEGFPACPAAGLGRAVGAVLNFVSGLGEDRIGREGRERAYCDD